MPSKPKIIKYGAYNTSTKGKTSNEIYSLKIIAPRSNMRRSKKLLAMNIIRKNFHVTIRVIAKMKTVNTNKRKMKARRDTHFIRIG